MPQFDPHSEETTAVFEAINLRNNKIADEKPHYDTDDPPFSITEVKAWLDTLDDDTYIKAQVFALMMLEY